MTSTTEVGANTPATGRKATDVETRRTFLLAVVRNNGGRVTTSGALHIYAGSPWRTASRNTARRDLRDLARRAYLVPVDTPTGRFYQVGDDPNPAHPVRGIWPRMREEIRREGGEWTVGRVKRAVHRITGTHVLRMSCRRILADLHRDGHLERHGDDSPRRYYTLRENGDTR